MTFQTRKDASADDSIILDEELNNDVPDDAKIIEGLCDTRGAQQTVENATSVFVKWPALNQLRFVSMTKMDRYNNKTNLGVI